MLRPQAEAGLDAKGRARRLAASHRRPVDHGRHAFARGMVKDGIDRTSVEGAANLPYAIPEHRRRSERPPRPACRCCGGASSAARTPPLRSKPSSTKWRTPPARIPYRVPPRAARAPAAHEGGAGAGRREGRLEPARCRKGRGRGIAVAEAFNTYVAQVAEVSVDGERPGQGRPRGLRRRLRHRRSIRTSSRRRWRAASASALGAALYGAITLKDGQVEQTNFDDYQVLRINEMPKVEVHIVPSTEAPTGVGEPGVAPSAPPSPMPSSPRPASGCAFFPSLSAVRLEVWRRA